MPRFRRLALAFLLALGLALGTVHKARGLGSPDFKVFYTAARHTVVDPENLYRVSPDRYLYPPSTAILLLPFAFSEHYAWHQWLWHGLLAALLGGLAAVSGAALAACFLLSRYLVITFMYGQVQLPLIAMLAGTAALWRKNRTGASGSLWALAASLKVYPAVLAPAFLGRRERWRGFLTAGVTLGGILLLPFLFFGPALAWQLYGEFLGALESKGLPLHSHNQSIAALLLRLGTGARFELHSVGPTEWGIVHADAGLVRALAWIAGGALTLASWWRARGRKFAPEACLSAAAFSVLFLSHIVWKDYLLFLYFPLREVFARWPRRPSVALGAAFLALVTLSSPDVLGAPLAARLDAACIHLWAAGLVWWAWWKE